MADLTDHRSIRLIALDRAIALSRTPGNAEDVIREAARIAAYLTDEPSAEDVATALARAGYGPMTGTITVRDITRAQDIATARI